MRAFETKEKLIEFVTEEKARLRKERDDDPYMNRPHNKHRKYVDLFAGCHVWRVYSNAAPLHFTKAKREAIGMVD
tara:strand:- start:193 stop:417 length:225 start_codon:yes stop_codon:yes gene_type:complete